MRKKAQKVPAIEPHILRRLDPMEIPDALIVNKRIFPPPAPPPDDYVQYFMRRDAAAVVAPRYYQAEANPFVQPEDLGVKMAQEWVFNYPEAKAVNPAADDGSEENLE